MPTPRRRIPTPPTPSSRPPTAIRTAPRKGVAASVGGYTYGAIARMTGLDHSHVCRVMAGTRGVSTAALGRIADATGIPVGELAAHIDTARRAHGTRPPARPEEGP